MRLNCVKQLGFTVLFISILTLLPVRANASGIVFTLDPIFGSAGDTVTIFGTITNPSTTTVYLNGDSPSLGTLVNFDDSLFLLSGPLCLDPSGTSGACGGSSTGDIPLFAAEIDPAALAGIYTDNFISILGGGDPSAMLTLANTELDLTVPEPSSLILLSTGLVVIFLFGSRRLLWPQSKIRSLET